MANHYMFKKKKLETSSVIQKVCSCFAQHCHLCIQTLVCFRVWSCESVAVLWKGKSIRLRL